MRIGNRQRLFGFASWGGKRRGAGRKPKGRVARVAHDTRPVLAARFPVHVTVKLRTGLPSLRRKEAHRVLLRSFEAWSRKGAMRLVHYSIQSNHLHMIVEVGGRSGGARTLSRAMQGLCVRVARALNRLWRRTGRLFADRYHAHVLRTPREVRNAIAYVLGNSDHHRSSAGSSGCLDRLDHFSSGASFDGWRTQRRFRRAMSAVSSSSFLSRARTWLLQTGWRRHGLIPL